MLNEDEFTVYHTKDDMGEQTLVGGGYVLNFDNLKSDGDVHMGETGDGENEDEHVQMGGERKYLAIPPGLLLLGKKPRLNQIQQRVEDHIVLDDDLYDKLFELMREPRVKNKTKKNGKERNLITCTTKRKTRRASIAK
jgi:hypothetical protein